MNEEDRQVRYLESGDPNDDDGSLTAVRRALRDPRTWESPPHAVAESVLAEIRSDTSPFATRARSPRLRRVLAAAAGLVAVVLVVVMVWSPGRGTVVELAGTELEPEASGVAALEATGSGWSIRLDLEDLPPAEEGYYYEGWVWSDDGDGVSIGTFHLREGTQSLILWAGVDVDEYPSIWISRQAEGAGAGVSDEIVMTGRLEEGSG